MNNQKVHLLLDDLKDERLDLVLMKPDDQNHYEAKVQDTIKLLKYMIGSERADRKKEEWEDEVLVYFAGHGATIDKSIRLETPEVDATRRFGFVKFDDVVDLLSDTDLNVTRRIFIIDACRPAVGGKAPDNLDIGNASMKIYDNFLKTKTKWDFYFSTKQGGYSYEETQFGLRDIVKGFDLWPTEAISKSGNGLFTIGFLSSLICGDIVDYPAEPAYNVNMSYRYMNDRFFSQWNGEWRRLEPDIKQDLQNSGLDFVKPEPEYLNGSGEGARHSFVFRNLDAKPKQCFAEPH